MLQVGSDRPLSQVLVGLIRALDRVAVQLDITYFIIGATARDILMEHVYQLQTTRATVDALGSALDVVIAPGLPVKIVSLPAMVMLKILAWNDRPDRDKHASDVLLVMRNYEQAGQAERLYAEAPELLVAHGHDPELAGAALLGRDARRDVSQETRAQVIGVFASVKRLEKFTAQMMRAQSGRVGRAELLLSAFLQELHA